MFLWLFDAPDMPFKRQALAHIGLDAKIDKEAPKAPAVPSDERRFFERGASLSRALRPVIMAFPREPKTFSAQGMYPRPPQLLKGKGVTDDPAGESYGRSRMAFA